MLHFRSACVKSKCSLIVQCCGGTLYYVSLICYAAFCVLIIVRTLKKLRCYYNMAEAVCWHYVNLYDLFLFTQCNEPKTDDSPSADVGLPNSTLGKRSSESGF